MGAYRVTAPYVTLTVHDDLGGVRIVGFYDGAIVNDPVDPEQVQAHLRKGLLEEFDASVEPEPKPAAKASAKKAALSGEDD